MEHTSNRTTSFTIYPPANRTIDQYHLEMGEVARAAYAASLMDEPVKVTITETTSQNTSAGPLVSATLTDVATALLGTVICAPSQVVETSAFRVVGPSDRIDIQVEPASRDHSGAVIPDIDMTEAWRFIGAIADENLDVVAGRVAYALVHDSARVLAQHRAHHGEVTSAPMGILGAMQHHERFALALEHPGVALASFALRSAAGTGTRSIDLRFAAMFLPGPITKALDRHFDEILGLLVPEGATPQFAYTSSAKDVAYSREVLN